MLVHSGKFGKSSFQASAKANSHFAKMSLAESPKFNRFPRSVGLGLVCNYCHEKGHWKADCSVLRNKSRTFGKFAKPVALSAPVRHISIVSEQKVHPVKPVNDTFSGFEAFVSDGFVALKGSDSKVPVKILRDTGAKDSFVLAKVLPFSPESDTGHGVLVRGMGLTTLFLCIKLVCLVVW